MLLGSTKSEGLPLELFSSGEARWLGVQLNLPGEEEQARVLLVSVPYALKAADAETLGGKPPSAFLLAEKAEGGEAAESKPGANKEAVKEGPRREQVVGTITGEGTVNMVSKFTGANTIGDGSLFDNGFVGVGNTNPFGKLTVTHPLSGSVTKALLLESHYDLNSGAKIVFDSLSNNGERASLGYSIASGGGGHLFFHTSQQGGFPALERMRITNTGSVGIGSSNPFGKLTVTNPVAGSVSKGLLLESHYDLNSGSKIVFDSLSNNGERASIGYSIVSGGGGDLFFNTSQQGGFPVSERMRITNTGNVGIGTATPGQKLTVAGTIESTSGGFKFPDGSTQTTAGGGGTATDLNCATPCVSSAEVDFNFAGSSSKGGMATNADLLDGLDSAAFAAAAHNHDATYVNVSGDTMAGTLNLPANGLAVGTNQLVAASGRVGIGTASPSSLLHLSDSNAELRLTDSDNTVEAVLGAFGAGIIGLTAVTNHKIEFSTGGSPKMRILTTGNTGIGPGLTISDPQAVLHVIGSQPPASGSGNGTAATSVLQITGAKGGNTVCIPSGSFGGAGASVNITAGAGGDVTSVSCQTGDGGDITLQPGAPGTGGFVTNFGDILLAPSGGNVGIGTATPTSILSLGGEAARTFGMERRTVADTPGNHLTVQAGGATGGATDKNGGHLILSGGVSTGAGSSQIAFQTATGGVSGTADNVPTNKMIIFGNGNVTISGDLSVGGTLSKGGGSFRIDHPLDPAHKYLSHSFVESPDMMNVYNGNVRLDANGEAWVELPEWFEALNRDFRYQLTALGAPGPNLYIAEEVSGNRFKIAGGRPGSRVSWQVTGVRKDAYANAYRIKVEEEKPLAQRGSYLHPELFGPAKEKGFESTPPPTKVAAEK